MLMLCMREMSMTIPPKVTADMIIKSVGDLVTLRACALVCRGWLTASRHQLFRRFTIISEPGFEGTYRSLVNNVLRSKNLCQYLHSVLEVWSFLLRREATASVSSILFRVRRPDAKPPAILLPQDVPGTCAWGASLPLRIPIRNLVGT